MASFKQYTASGGASEAFSINTFSSDEIKVYVDNVLKTAATHYNITSYTTSGGTVTWTDGNVPSSGTVRIVRDTGVLTSRATYAAGSSVKADDLNNNQTQVLRSLEEQDDQLIQTYDVQDSAITTAKIKADNITSALIADDQINSEHYVDGSIDTAHIADAQITTAKLAADAVNGTKIADDSINSEHYVDGSIDTAHIADSQITSAKIADGTIVAGDLASNAITTDKITDLNVTTAKIAADAITGAKIVDDAINSEHYTDGSIDTAHIGDSQVTTAKIAADAITNAKIADDQIDSEHYVDGSIDTAHIGATQVTDAKLASNAVTTSKITDANVTTAKVADSNITLAKLASDLKQTTISNSDTQLPTSGAVVDYVAAQIAPLGGLEVIATDAAFPNTQPSAGVVISIADAGGIVVDGSGSSTTGRTVGGSTVTINGINSAYNSSTVTAGVGFLVSSTGSGQIYNFHKSVVRDQDILSISSDINDFANRYRVASSAPSSNNDAGDLYFNTTSNKLFTYNGDNSAWEEAQSVGNFYINTISSYSGTGGNSASFNGEAYRFVLSNAPANAEQLLVSVNGVVQKPNSGTSQPGEGFAIDGSSIIFSAAPATGSDFFIITIGASVNIGAPSDGTVTAAKIASGAVATVKIADDAVTGAKIADDAINSEHYTDGSIDTAHIAADQITGALIADDAVGAEHIEALDANLQFEDSVKAQFGTGNDYVIYHDGTNSHLHNTTGNLYIRSGGNTIVLRAKDDEQSIECESDGAVNLFYDNSKKLETTSTGAKITSELEVIGGEGDNAYIYLTADEGDDVGDKWRLRATPVGGNYYVQNYNGTSWETSIHAIADGPTELYYDDVKTLSTRTEGIFVKYSIKIEEESGSEYYQIVTNSYGGLEFQNETTKVLELTDANGMALIGDMTFGANSYGTLQEDGAQIVFKANTAAKQAHIMTHDGAEDINLDPSGFIQFEVDGAERARITSDGSLGIGTNAPGQLLSLKNTSAQCQQSLMAATDGSCAIYFGDTDSINRSVIYHHNTDDYLAFYTAGSERMRINQDGVVSINTTGTSFDSIHGNLNIANTNANNWTCLGLSRNTTNGRSQIRFNNPNGCVGSVTTNDSATAFNTSSDYRLKENQVAISDGITRVKQLKPYKFNFKVNPSKIVDGFFAHEVTPVVPEAISGEKDAVMEDGSIDAQSIDQAKLVPLLTAALQEAITKIETLETKVAALEAK